MVFDIMLCKDKSFLFLVCLLLLPGCGSSLKEFVSSSSTGNAFQAGPPDEFLSVTKKPLVMPPDYFSIDLKLMLGQINAYINIIKPNTI